MPIERPGILSLGVDHQRLCGHRFAGLKTMFNSTPHEEPPQPCSLMRRMNRRAEAFCGAEAHGVQPGSFVCIRAVNPSRRANTCSAAAIANCHCAWRSAGVSG